MRFHRNRQIRLFGVGASSIVESPEQVIAAVRAVTGRPDVARSPFPTASSPSAMCHQRRDPHARNRLTRCVPERKHRVGLVGVSGLASGSQVGGQGGQSRRASPRADVCGPLSEEAQMAAVGAPDDRTWHRQRHGTLTRRPAAARDRRGHAPAVAVPWRPGGGLTCAVSLRVGVAAGPVPCARGVPGRRDAAPCHRLPRALPASR